MSTFAKAPKLTNKARKFTNAVAYSTLFTGAILFARLQINKVKRRIQFIDALNDVKLLTPFDIDKKVLER